MVSTISSHDADAMQRAVAALRQGAIVAMPTDTVYGLAASLARPDAIRRLYTIKGRPSEKAIPILLADVSDASLAVESLPPLAEALARRFWPGGLTLVVPCGSGLPPHVTSTDAKGTATVALRVPGHELARALIREVGGALAVTSANASGQAPALDALAIGGLPFYDQDLILDGGPTPGDRPSTIIRIAGERMTLLRVGAIPTGDINRTYQEWHEGRSPHGAV